MRKFALLVAPVLLASGLSLAAPGDHLVLIHGSIPRWATPSSMVATVAPNETVNAEFVLPWSDPAGVDALVRAVSDPASPNYARFLSQAEFRARFAPSTSLVDAVTRWARASGLEVGVMPKSKIIVPIRANAATMARAFGTSFARFAVQGLALRAPLREPSLPASLANADVGIIGLDERAALIRTSDPDASDQASLVEGVPTVRFNAGGDPVPDPSTIVPAEPATPADFTPPPAVVYAKPCSAYNAAYVNARLPALGRAHPPAVACATTPQQLRAAYGVNRLGIDGTGQTVVMIGSHAIQTLPGDVDTWSKRHGVPGLRDGQLRQISYPSAYQTPVLPASPPVADPTGEYPLVCCAILRPQVWAQQSAMIFENVHAIAPGADMVYVGSTSSLDLYGATLLAVEDNIGGVVINGWYSASEDGGSPPEDALITQIAQDGAATGVSVLFASGDLGDNKKFNGTTPNVATVCWPANNPNITAVGATSLLIGRGGAYLGELGWAKTARILKNGNWAAADDSRYRASGGGTSIVFAQPYYQRGITDALARRADGSFGRTVPDVAVSGDAETAMSIGYTQTFPDGSKRYSERRVGADTAATGLFAALVALVNQRKGHLHGFLNPMLYETWHTTHSAFRDILYSGHGGAGVRTDYTNGADPSGGLTLWLKTFEAFGQNITRRGYDTSTGLGSPSPVWFRAMP